MQLLKRSRLSARAVSGSLDKTVYFSSSSAPQAHRAIVFQSKGPPSEVLTATTFPTLPLIPCKGWLNVKVLLAPINPSDINVIEGKYPSRPAAVSSWAPGSAGYPSLSVPMYPVGNEGLAEVTALGHGVEGLEVGDKVIITQQQTGTWASARTLKQQAVMRMPEGLTDVNAATMTVNPATAYNMMHVNNLALKPGDWILQNGANSAVGQAVIQIAKHKGYRTINVVRNRSDFADLKKRLHDLGADVVVTYEDFAGHDMKRRVQDWCVDSSGVRLLLNCVGGKSLSDMVRLLSPGATVVTYGGMAKEPTEISTSALIFRDIRFFGFWQSRWYSENSHKRQHLINALAEIQLVEPEHEILTLSAESSDEEVAQQVKDVIKKLGEGKFGKKVLLQLEDPQED